MLHSAIAAPLVLGAVIFAGIAVLPDHSAIAQSGAKATNTETRPIQASPAQPKQNDRQQQPGASGARREENKQPPDTTKYSWEFNQPRFYIRHILIEHDASGRGKITFQRQGEEAAIIEPVELSTGALGRILGLWTSLRFLDSIENYQSERQFAHLGTMKLHMEHDDRNRTAEFNWTNNRDASALNNEYHHVADQAIFIFDLAIARENQPLNAPKLMEELEGLLNRGSLSDPYQLVPLLREITTDEHLPLIARNHATRILKKIEK